MRVWWLLVSPRVSSCIVVVKREPGYNSINDQHIIRVGAETLGMRRLVGMDQQQIEIIRPSVLPM
jgi:hypothetical protein